MPEVIKYDFEVKILGLRDLQSAGVLSVKRPYIDIDLSSIIGWQKKSKYSERTRIQTPTNFYGKNPTIATVLNFSCYLPKDYIFCPTLTVIFFKKYL